MSLTRMVAEEIARRGSATADELLPDFPARTREQVMSAIKNASAARQIHCREMYRAKGLPRHAQAPVRYYPGPKPGGGPATRPASARAAQSVRPPNSPWELASDRTAQVWPPAYEGRKCAPLGSWSADA